MTFLTLVAPLLVITFLVGWKRVGVKESSRIVGVSALIALGLMVVLLVWGSIAMRGLSG